MKEIALVADRHTVTCFKLAGLRNIFSVEDSKDAEKCILALLEKNNIEIILVSERLLNKIKIFEKIVDPKGPLIIPIPQLKRQKKFKTDLISELIKSKTGIEMKF